MTNETISLTFGDQGEYRVGMRLELCLKVAMVQYYIFNKL